MIPASGWIPSRRTPGQPAAAMVMEYGPSAGIARLLEISSASCHNRTKTPNPALRILPPLPNPEKRDTLSSMPVMDTQAAGGQPLPTPQTLPAGAEQAQGQPFDAQTVIDGMNDETEIGNLLFGKGTPPPVSTQAATEPQGTVPGDTNPPAGETAPQEPAGAQPQEPATEPLPQEATTAAQTLERISLKSLHPDERLLIAQAKDLVREGKAASFADAFQSLTKKEAGTQEPAPQAQAQQAQEPDPQPAPAQAPPVVEQDTEVQRLTSELARLRAERMAAVENFERPTELQLTAEIEDTIFALAQAKAAAVLQARESTAIQNQLDAVIQDIYVEHPDSEDPSSYFSYLMSREVESYEKAHGPIANHPAQLKSIASRVASQVGKVQQPVAPQPNLPAPVIPRQQARPIGTAAPGSAATARPSPDQLQKLIESANEEELREALFSGAV